MGGGGPPAQTVTGFVMLAGLAPARSNLATEGPTRSPRIAGLVALMIAGEAVFGLPFHVARYFRPTLLAGLGLSNSELGAVFSAYGVLALLGYFPGGLLADRYPARSLLCAALLLTAAGGVYLLSLPGLRGLVIVFAYFGVTTVLLFWAALIRAVRAWGEAGGQGRAFGLLDGGRGLVSAGLATLAWLALRAGFSGAASGRLAALRGVIAVYLAATVLAAGLVWLLVPADAAGPGRRGEAGAVARVLAAPSLWLHALVVLCAYCGFKSIDDFSLFAVEAYGVDEVEGARINVLAAWLRPLAALGAGLLADRLAPTRVTQLCFGVLIASQAGLAVVEPRAAALPLFWAGVAATVAAAFGLRGVYFAILEQLRVPAALTGTAVGLVSVVGFAPDIFLGPVTGWLLDHNPGAGGHRQVFLLFAALSGLGLLASLALGRARPRWE